MNALYESNSILKTDVNSINQFEVCRLMCCHQINFLQSAACHLSLSDLSSLKFNMWPLLYDASCFTKTAADRVIYIPCVYSDSSYLGSLVCLKVSVCMFDSEVPRTSGLREVNIQMLQLHIVQLSL